MLAGVAGGAFLLRLGTRLWLTDAASVDEGYTFYLGIARTFVQGGGLCAAPGEACSQRVPVYPLLLAPLVAGGWLFPGLAIVQSAIGALTVWLTGAMARDVFGARAALVAAILAALNPYAVVHDTALQETSLVNCLLALSLFLLLPLRRSEKPAAAVAAGATLGLAVLTTARVALLVPPALLWTVFVTPVPWQKGIRRAVLVALPLVLLVGGWMLRNWRIEGAPVLTTETGISLWLGNNAWTFESFPRDSIDRVSAASFASATPEQWADIRATIGKPVERDRLLRGWARDAVAADPVTTVVNAARKIWVVLSARYTPERSTLVQWGYAAFFLPIHMLAAWTLWRTWRTDRAHLLTMGVLTAFLFTTAVFWAHTSHKSLVDAVLLVYASAGLADARRTTA